MADARSRYLAEHTARIILAKVDHDNELAGKLVEEVGNTYGHDGVFAVCYGMAEAIRKLVFPQIARGDGSLTGDIITLECVGDPSSSGEAAALWAARFVAGFINGDAGLTTSLFYGGLDDREQTLDNVAALIGMTGDVARRKEQDLHG